MKNGCSYHYVLKKQYLYKKFKYIFLENLLISTVIVKNKFNFCLTNFVFDLMLMKFVWSTWRVGASGQVKREYRWDGEPNSPQVGGEL